MTRLEGIQERVIAVMLEIMAEQGAATQNFDTDRVKRIVKATTETYSTGTFTLGAGASQVFNHNLGYIPSVTLVSSSDCFISGLTDTAIQITSDGGATNVIAYCH